MRDKKRYFHECLAALLFAIALPVTAIESHELSLEELLETRLDVLSASKRPQKAADAPAMVRVVGADEIRSFGWRTLAEALNSLPGVYTAYDRSYTSIGLRGFGRPGDYNNRLLVLIDGVPFNDGVYDQAAMGSDFSLDIELVDRIEYIPGPSSSLYGGNAILGVVNVITADGRQGSLVEAGIGERGTRNLRAVFGRRDEAGNDWLFSASRLRRDGDDLFFRSYAGTGANAWSRGLDYDDSDRFMARFARGGFLASLIANSRDKGAPGGPFGADLDDKRNSNRDQSLRLNLSYEHYLDPARKFNVYGYALGYDYVGRWAYASVLSRDAYVNRALGGEARMMVEFSAPHTLVYGISWRYDYKRRQHNEALDTDTPRHALGLFLQDDWRLTDWLTLSVGGRFDHVTTAETYRSLSPRLAAIVTPDPATRIKFIAGGAFRPPNSFETEYMFPGTNLASPKLKPEKISSIELGIERRVSAQTELSATLYRNHIHNLITLETDVATGLQQHQNTGMVIARGLELAASTQWVALHWRGSLSWQSASLENGVPLANAPQRLAKLLATAPLGSDTKLGWEVQYVGPRNTESGNILSRGRTVGGYTLANATLTGGGRNGLAWQLSLTNLFDRRYSAVVGAEFNSNYPGVQTAPMSTMFQDARTLYGSLRWSF